MVSSTSNIINLKDKNIPIPDIKAINIGNPNSDKIFITITFSIYDLHKR